MNILKQKSPETDVQKWSGRIRELKAQAADVETQKAGALQALGVALLDGDGDGGEAVARLEAKAKGLTLAIAEAERRLAQAKADEKARQIEAARAAEQKLGAELRQAWIAFGRSVADELAALQKLHAVHQAYLANSSGLPPGVADQSSRLGNPAHALQHVVSESQSLAVKLGPEDFARTGLPKYVEVSLERKP
jgi:DNA repair exonuclease SbcCD ATPase subunit